MVFSCTKTRVRAAPQAYSHYYWEEKIKAVALERYEQKLIEEGKHKEGDAGPLGVIPIEFRMAVAKELYEAESQEFKDQLDIRRKQDTISVLDQSDKKVRRAKLEMYQKSVVLRCT
jgi:hypothetical protein